MTDKLKNAMNELAQLMKELCQGYVESRIVEPKHKEVIFATRILGALDSHHKIIGNLSKILRKDIADSIHTHHIKYINKFKELPELTAELGKFEDHFKELKTSLKQEQNSELGLATKDFDTFCKILANILQTAQRIFSEQNHNDDEINLLIAETIAFQIPNLQASDTETLTSDLLAVRELWTLDDNAAVSIDDKKVKFLNGITTEIDFSDVKKETDVLLKIIDYLVNEQKILIGVSDPGLLAMYNRVRNNDRFINQLYDLIVAIYGEAKLRYSCSRLSDSGYEILNKFQKFESIVQQINDLEHKFVEKFLVSNNYLGHALVFISKHVENIIALKLTNDKNFISLVDKIDSAVRSLKVEGGNPQLKSLNNLHDKLSTSLDTAVAKKYADLDHFQFEYAKRQYTQFFKHALEVIEEKENFKNYLKTVFDHKLAYDFYLPNATNSIDKMRAMEADRKTVNKLLDEIDLISIFHVFSGNNIHSLDFRKGTQKKDSQTPQEYVASLLKTIIQECSAFQLEALYKPLIGKELNNTEEQLKTELAHQIHIRTSLSKMLVSVVTGRKKEYNKLKELKKT